MNVIFLLLTSVSAGSNPVINAPAAAHPAPIAVSSSGCCGAVSDCCVAECDPCCKPRRSRRSKDCCCEVVSCAPACPTPCAQPCPTPCCAPACKPACQPACCAPACQPAPCCAPACQCQPACCEVTCDPCCEKPKRCFFGLFRRKKDCCEIPCCDPCCGTTGTVIHAAPVQHGAVLPGVQHPAPAQPLPGNAVEPIKKMPKDDGDKEGVLLAPTAPVTPAGAKIQSRPDHPF